MQAVLDYLNLDVSNPVTGECITDVDTEAPSQCQQPRCSLSAREPAQKIGTPGCSNPMQGPAAVAAMQVVLRAMSAYLRNVSQLLRCAVMTQEMCKDFLAGSSNRDASARQRYKLYMKATSLEQAEEGLTRARINVADTQDRLKVRACARIKGLCLHDCTQEP